MYPLMCSLMHFVCFGAYLTQYSTLCKHSLHNCISTTSYHHRDPLYKKGAGLNLHQAFSSILEPLTSTQAFLHGENDNFFHGLSVQKL